MGRYILTAIFSSFLFSATPAGRFIVLCVLGSGDEKFPEPGPVEQKEVEKQVKELLPPPGKDQNEIRRHAKKLLEAGKSSSQRPIQSYVLLKQARELAAGVGDYETALSAARTLGERYEVDLPGMEVDVLSTAARSTAAGATSGLVKAYLEVMDHEQRHLDFENSRRLSTLVQALSRKIESAWLRGNLESRLEKLRSIEQWKKTVKDAKGKLAADPKDPAANENLGKVLCLAAGNWEAGLPLLALCGNQKLADAAKVELLHPEGNDMQYELGKSWLELSQGEKEAHLARAMLLRAGHWYDAALPGLTGLNRAIVADQLSKMPERFLCDMEEFDMVLDRNLFGKRGELGFSIPETGTRIVVEGLSSEHGISLHAIASAEARVKYPLNRMFKRLRAWVALNDSAWAAERPLTFVVRGDGKLLWKSRPVQKKGQSQLCEASVEGMATLELSVECPGSNLYLHAVWLDPVVTR